MALSPEQLSRLKDIRHRLENMKHLDVSALEQLEMETRQVINGDTLHYGTGHYSIPDLHLRSLNVQSAKRNGAFQMDFYKAVRRLIEDLDGFLKPTKSR